MVAIYALLVCKISGLKIWSCKFFDKSHVCAAVKDNKWPNKRHLQVKGVPLQAKTPHTCVTNSLINTMLCLVDNMLCQSQNGTSNNVNFQWQSQNRLKCEGIQGQHWCKVRSSEACGRLTLTLLMWLKPKDRTIFSLQQWKCLPEHKHISFHF